MKESIATLHAPVAIGPYSQAVRAGNLVFVSGQLPLNPATGLMAEGTAAQTKQALANVAAILEQAGLTLNHVVKTTVFMTDLSGFAEMNEVYASLFSQPFPSRSAVQVAALPKGAALEIECIALAGA